MKDILVIISAIAVTVSWGLLIGPIELGGLSLLAGNLGYCALIALSIPVLGCAPGSARARLFLGFAVVTLLDLPAMAARGSGVELQHAYLIGALIALVGVAPVLVGRKLWSVRKPGLGLGGIAIVSVIALLSIGAFQFFNRIQRSRGVPNEERSVFLGPVESHHINWGVILVVVIVGIWPLLVDRAWSRWLGIAAVGLAWGLVLDEWLYYALVEVSDAAYFSSITVISGVGSVAVCGGIAMLWREGRDRS
jgi:hypothetical protein